MKMEKFNEELPEFVKYVKIPYINESPDLYGREVYIFEKIDGSLCQIRKTKNGIIGGSRANYMTGLTKPGWGDYFLKWMHTNSSLYNLKPEIIMFGEWLDPVTIDYDKEMTNKFYFIDLAIVENGRLSFYDYMEALDYLTEWNINGVEIMPIIAKKFVDESIALEILKKQPSYLRSLNYDSKTGEVINSEMEGIVLKNYTLQKFAKVLHPKYSEIREEAKTLEGKYVNQPRIDKAIRRIQDNSGKNVELNLENIVREVQRDILDETRKEVSFDSIKSIIRAKNFFRDNR